MRNRYTTRHDAFAPPVEPAAARRSMSAGAAGLRVASRSAALLALLAALLVSCGLGLPTEIDAPTGAAASTDQVDQITVSWNPVAAATRYYVYRSTSPTAPLWTEGDYGPIPYATTNTTSFVDPVPGTATYHYQVSAVHEFTGSESAPTDVVTGVSIDGPNEWQAASILALESLGTVRIAVDRDSVRPVAYVLSVPQSADTGVTVSRVEAEGTLTQLGSPFATVDGTFPRVADLAVTDGQLRVALSNSTSDEVEVWSYSGFTDAFTRLDTAGTTPSPISPLVALAARAPDDFWLAYKTLGTTMATYRSGDAGALTAATAPSGATPLADLELTAGGGVVAMGYELVDGIGNTTGVEISVAGASDWGSPADAFVSGAGNVSALDVAVDPSDGSAYLVYGDDAGDLYLDDETGALGATITDGDFGGSSPASPADVALAGVDGVLALFYLDDAAGAGVIRESSDGGATWSVTSPDDFTATAGLGVLDLSAAANSRFAAYATSGGFGFARSFQ